MKLSRYILIAAALTTSTVAFAHGPRGFWKEADANQDDKITQDEARAFADARFTEVDTNKDGIITRAEADALRAKHAAKFKAKGEEHFAAKDTNKDGKLSQSEVPRMPAEIFKKLDANGDGGITKEEFAAAKPPHGHKGGPKGEHAGKGKHGDLFAMMDQDGDGKVTRAEAQAASEKHFARADKNSDGVLTKDELRRGPRGSKGESPEGKRHGRDKQ